MMKKGLILVVVMGVALVIFTLILVALTLMTNESRIAEHKIRRMRGFYAAQAGSVLVLEQLRKGAWTYNTTYCINGSVSGASCADTVNDPYIPYNVEMSVGAQDSGISGTAEIKIRVVYGG